MVKHFASILPPWRNSSSVGAHVNVLLNAGTKECKICEKTKFPGLKDAKADSLTECRSVGLMMKSKMQMQGIWPYH